jgi:putative lipoic acid-binding regulatory protein
MEYSMNQIINGKPIENEFPREIIFKAVFRTEAQPLDTIKSCLIAHELDFTISDKVSSNGKFISYTIRSRYETEELLNSVCDGIVSIDGYMMMV